MQALIDVILPVFLVIGAGYAASWRGLLPENAVDGLMGFATTIAIPCLLFRAIWQLDLGAHFSPALLVSFYAGAVLAFTAGLLAARFVFARDWEDAVAVGFACLFSNSLLLGLPITERAYGPEALNGNYAIIAMHSPFCYALGITAMEIARARGTEIRRLPLTVIRAMFRNALVIGILIGVVFNLGDFSLPSPVMQALDMITRTALPAALFALGGVLFRYRPEGDLRLILTVCAIALGLHPAITYLLGTGLNLPLDSLRSGVVTAAMAPGINAFLFANMYGRAKRVAASSVLLATGLCIVTSWLWLQALP
ncbi:AEC family transporter [Salipiger sp. P9]|uniref:AEC family transporter n=1 Tax=Salipiger pentaromativorans TaxID=2943193 RepID=UPI002157FEB5|nr:AEC family transporter [Salipiger pentaromativorans]MCR8546514.1 AEC family transporter [Salipiger pentaromativorans]